MDRLTHKKVRDLRDAVAKAHGQTIHPTDLAVRYEVTIKTINNAINGKNYVDMEGALDIVFDSNGDVKRRLTHKELLRVDKFRYNGEGYRSIRKFIMKDRDPKHWISLDAFKYCLRLQDLQRKPYQGFDGAFNDREALLAEYEDLPEEQPSVRRKENSHHEAVKEIVTKDDTTMPYRVLPDGSIEVASLEEAIALSKKIAAAAAGAPQMKASAPKKQNGISGESRQARQFYVFAATLNGNHKRFLSAIKTTGGITLVELRKELNLKSKARLSGIISSMVKRLNWNQIPSEDLFIRSVAGPQRSRVVTYKPGPILESLDAEMLESE